MVLLERMLSFTGLKSVGFQGRAKKPHQKPVVVALDNDGCLTNWITYSKSIQEEPTQAVADLLNSPAVRPYVAVAAITGRAFTGAQQVGDFYRQVPIDYWGTANGFRLDVNDKGQPAPEWIRSLKPDSGHPLWARDLVQHFRYNLASVSQALQKHLSQWGFKPVSAWGYKGYDETRTLWGRPIPSKYPKVKAIKTMDYGALPQQEMLLASFYPDGTSLVFERPSQQPLLANDTDSHAMDNLMKQVKQDLKQQGLAVKTRKGPYKHTILHDVVAQAGDGKAIFLKNLLQRFLPGARMVITTGDSTFDVDYLRPKLWIVEGTNPESSKRQVPAFPIQVGDVQEVTQALSGHPRAVQVGRGQLVQGLVMQLKTIGQRLKIKPLAQL